MWKLLARRNKMEKISKRQKNKIEELYDKYCCENITYDVLDMLTDTNVIRGVSYLGFMYGYAHEYNIKYNIFEIEFINDYSMRVYVKR